MSPKSAIFLSKTEARVSRLPRREKRRKGKSPRNLSGVEDLNGGNQGRALGGSRLSRRRHSCAGAAPWDPVAVPPQAGVRTRACDS